MLAELLLQSYGSDRSKMLQNVLQLFEIFLSRLDNYTILSAEDRNLYERFQENRSSFQLAPSTNVEERRKVKVARFQQEKSLKAKLEVRWTATLPRDVLLMFTVPQDKVWLDSSG